MCHRVDRKIINSVPIQFANGKSFHMPPSNVTTEKKHFLQLLMQRLRIKLFNYRSDRDTVDGINAYRFDRNFEMRPNHNLSHQPEEKSHTVRNWRYHLTNNHF